MSRGLPPVLIERLGKDHGRIAGVIRELEDLADPTAGEPDWQRLRELVEFLDYYADRVHHPLEDRLFDHLVNKGLTPTERQLVFKNLRQHEEIKGLTEALGREIEICARAGGTDLFQAMLVDYLALQRRHMRFEETHLFPLLEAEFDNKDWNVLMGILEQHRSVEEETS